MGEGGYLAMGGSGGAAAVATAKVHPVVLVSIADSFLRRTEGSDRVIGTLLGTPAPDGSVDIKNAYAVPHSDAADQVAVDIDFHRTMYELHQRVSPKEVIVGWYSTGNGVTGSDALLQDFYSKEAGTLLPSPIHLTVDTALTNGRMAVRAFVSSPLTIGDRQLAAHFSEVPVDVRTMEAERIGVELLRNPLTDRLPTDLEGLEGSMQRLQHLIEMSVGYVDNVLARRVAPDNAIGRYLADTVASIPYMTPEAFEKLFNDSIQDVLLTVYLSNLTRTQLALAEKISTASVPLLQ
eukprot:jgi/Chlat1/9191/Chrsp97S08474